MDTKSKTCRDCGGSEFYSRDVSLMGEAGQFLPVGIFSSREIYLRICGSCGLVDWFVKPSTLVKVKEEFTREP
jgi:hypothetical protein